MRKKLLIFVLLLFAAGGLFGQISLRIRTSHASFMQYDAVYIRMTMHNYTSHPLTFGSSSRLKGKVEFLIRDKDKQLVHRIRGKEDLAILQGIILKPGEQRTFTINLLHYYQLVSTGEYLVQALVSHPQLNASYVSNTVPLIIRKGQLKWQHKFGLPDYTGKGTAGKIQQRYYKMFTFNNGKVLSFYLVVDDDKMIYAVKRVGFYLGASLQPQHEVDAVGRLHLMIAASPKVFAYYIYNYDGTLEFRRVYIKTSTTPFLVVNPSDSSVIVDGGRIARKDLDYAEMENLPFADDTADISEEDKAFRLPETNDELEPGSKKLR